MLTIFIFALSILSLVLIIALAALAILQGRRDMQKSRKIRGVKLL